MDWQVLALSAVAGLAVGLMLATAWHAVADIEPDLALLIAACAVAARMALHARDGGGAARPQEEGAPDTPSQLLARMHHDLRTPLNAMIGFSEAMQRELHGPLGNARYQEYAAHITESGGRLLKASEDAIAIAATMSTLVAGRRVLRRERLPASALVQEAWVALGTSGRSVRLDVEDNAAVVEIDCDWQATSQALQHLLDEAIAHTPPAGTIMARSTRTANTRRIEIVAKSSPEGGCPSPKATLAAGDGLRLILIRSLLEMQGATLRLRSGPQPEAWSASITFPPPSWRRARRTSPSVPRRHRLASDNHGRTPSIRETAAPLVQ